MGETTGISWTDSTWNPWRGCIKISQGCKHCYMFRDQERYGRDPKEIVRAAPATFSAPLKWTARKVFTCSWSDFFIEQADTWRDEVWNIIRKTPNITYQVLTKRPERILDHLPADWGEGWPNVWLGVTVESQEYVHRLETLMNIRAAVRFVSYEPAIGPIYIGPLLMFNKVHWIISGGESGPGARPANPKWFRDVQQACEFYGVAYFHKQNGGTGRIDGKWGGDLLDGREYHEFPKVSA